MEGSRVEHKLEVGREAAAASGAKASILLRWNVFFASFLSAFCPFISGF